MSCLFDAILCRDAEEADIEKERKEQAKGPAARQHELEELTAIYEDRGLSYGLARQVLTSLAIAVTPEIFTRNEPKALAILPSTINTTGASFWGVVHSCLVIESMLALLVLLAL